MTKLRNFHSFPIRKNVYYICEKKMQMTSRFLFYKSYQDENLIKTKPLTKHFFLN